MDYKLAETEAQGRWLGRLADEVAEMLADEAAAELMRSQLELADRLAATVEAALTFHPDREVERIPERLPAIGEALAAFRAAREGGNQ